MMKSECLDKYFLLMEQRPQLFDDSDSLPIVKDREVIERFVTTTGKNIGVIYQSQYNLWIVDLIHSANGNLFTYERAVPSADGRGVVCIPHYKGQYILLKQYRHAIRSTQICFPRGFGENGVASFDNARKELHEEIGASVKWVEKIGEVAADSGLTSAIADVYLCEIDSYDSTACSEGITEIFLCSHHTLKMMIARGEINDSFTICAFALLSQNG
jgi:ADP-ribose pyrophosphatase